jgi:hypothetical protein
MFLTTALCAGTANGQTLTNVETNFYLGILSRLSAPKATEDQIERRIQHLRGTFALNQQETDTLRQTAKQFQSILSQLAAAEKTAVSGKAQLTENDRTAIARLGLERDGAVKAMIPGFLSSLRPETAQRFKRHVANYADLVSKAGAK